MKVRFYFLVVVMALSITNAVAQKRVVENAIKVAALVPATGGGGCKINTRSCAILNKAPDRTITVRIEESFVVNNTLSKKVVVMDKLAPGEKRYVGCAGSVTDGLNKESTGYKILLAYYDDPDPVGTKAISYDKQKEIMTSSR